MRKTILIALTMLIISANKGILWAEELPAVLSLNQIEQRLLDVNSKITAWYVEYQTAPTPLSHPTSPDSYRHAIVAAVAPDMCYLWAAKGIPHLDWAHDPFQQKFILNGEMSTNEWVWDRAMFRQQIAEDAPLPGTIPSEFLFRSLGWWPFTNRPAPVLERVNIPAVIPNICSSKKYNAKLNQVRVDGRLCHVIEYPSFDAIYVDCERGVIVKRMIFNGEPDGLIETIENKEIRLVSSGIWAPSRIINTYFDPDTHTNDQHASIAGTFFLKVVEINDNVKKSIFQFHPQPGELEMDRVTAAYSQVIPGGMEHFDEVATAMRRVYRHLGQPSFVLPGLKVIMALEIAVLLHIIVRQSWAKRGRYLKGFAIIAACLGAVNTQRLFAQETSPALRKNNAYVLKFWKGTENGTAGNNPCVDSGISLWRFDGITHDDWRAAENYHPLVWINGHWVVAEEPNLTYFEFSNDGIKCHIASTWNNNGFNCNVHTATTTFIAPIPGTYFLSGRASIETQNGDWIRLLVLKHDKDANRFIKAADEEVLPGKAVRFDKLTFHLAKGDEIVLLPWIVRREALTATVTLDNFEVQSDSEIKH